MLSPTLPSTSVRGLVLFAMFYGLACWLTSGFGLGIGDGAECWYPSGLAIYALLVFGWRYWPGILLGTVGGCALASSPLTTSVLVGAGQVGTGLVGYALLRQPKLGSGKALGRPEVGRLVTGVLVAPLVGVVLGGLGHLAGGTVDATGLGELAARWYVVELGTLVVALPLILHWQWMLTRWKRIRARFPSSSPWPSEEDSQTFGETIGAAISRSRDLRTGLQRSAEGMVAHLDLGLARIWVLDPDEQRLRLMASAGLTPRLDQPMDFALGEGAVGKVAVERAPYQTDSIADDEVALGREWCAERGLVSLTALPLLVEDRLVGVVAIFARAPLDAMVRQALSSVADGIAVGIERSRVELDLRRNQAFFAAVIEQAKDGIAIVDQEGRHQLVNPAYCGQTGYTSGELLDRTIYDLVPVDAHCEVSPLVEANRSDRRMFGLVRKDGTRFTAEVGGSPLSVAGERLTLAVVRDVTRELEAEARHRRLEEQLRLSQRMESVGQLAGGVAHDFNNLLLVILGHIDLAETALDEDEGEAVRTSLGEIKTATERAAVLTRQLLAFSRRQPLEFELLDLNELIRGLLRMLRRLVPESYEIEFAPGEDLGTIEADPGQLEQVLMNLAANARDALDEAGRVGHVRIATERTTVDAEMRERYPWATEGEYVMLSVEDDGAGMSPELAELVFDPFFTTKEVGYGTGMGLATVYGIVKQHGGHLNVETQPGQGTAVHLYWPAIDALPQDAPPGAVAGESILPAPIPAMPLPPRSRATILVVENYSLMRHLLADAVASLGYAVRLASDGPEALRLLEANGDGAISLLLCDWLLPGMSGLELARALQERHPRVKMVFLTCHPLETADPGEMPAVVAGWLHESPDPQALSRALRDALD